MARFILLFALGLLCQIETLLVPPREDSAAWLFLAARMAHGQMPQRDLWDNKLPPIYQIGRWALWTGSPQTTLWLLESALTAAAALAVWRMVRLTARQGSGNPLTPIRGRIDAADVAAALLCLATGIPSYHAGGYMTETYAMPLSTIAVWALIETESRSFRTIRWIIIGFCWTIAASFRLPLALAAVATVLFGLPFGRPSPADGRKTSQDKPRATICFALMAIGIVAALVLVFLHPLLNDYFADCIHWSILWPAGLAEPRESGPLSLSFMARLADFAQDIAKVGWLHLFAVGGLIATRHHVAPRILRIIAVWYLAAVISSLLGWASYAHYQYVVFAPMAVAIGLALVRLPRLWRLRSSILLCAITAAVVLVENTRGIARYRHPRDLADRANVIEYVRTHAAPNESVLFWLWGRNADLLYRCARDPGTRHFMAHAYPKMDMRLFREAIADIAAHPPNWLVDDREFSPTLTGTPPRRLPLDIAELQRLRSLVREDYQEAARFGQFTVLRRTFSGRTGVSPATRGD